MIDTGFSEKQHSLSKSVESDYGDEVSLISVLQEGQMMVGSFIACTSVAFNPLLLFCSIETSW